MKLAYNNFNHNLIFKMLFVNSIFIKHKNTRIKFEYCIFAEN